MCNTYSDSLLVCDTYSSGLSVGSFVGQVLSHGQVSLSGCFSRSGLVRRFDLAVRLSDGLVRCLDCRCGYMWVQVSWVMSG